MIMSQSWSFDFSRYLNEVSYVYAYWDLPKIVRCERQGAWAVKIDKIVLDCAHGHWVHGDARCMKLESWAFVRGVADSIKIDRASMEDAVRWQLDYGTR
ncbi:MAG: hypothetical protein JWO15_3610 [Sphingomonadales bacterium]|nr:hypothetical protein [Sphingomonadales bacterium]